MLARRSVVLLVALALAVIVYPTAAAPTPRFFVETGHTLADPMLAYWDAHGGLPVFGFPISEPFQERNLDLDRLFLTQYFERNRFEAHPENRPPYQILLGRLGAEALARQGRPWETLPKAPASAPHYFPQTGHAIAHAPFWSYWSAHGLELDGRRGFSLAESLALFGFPISEPQVETNSSGHRVLTQWFERARFEHHPDNPAPYRVLLGLLGNEITAGRRTEVPFQPVALGGAVRPDLSGKIAFARGADTWVYQPRTGTLRRLIERSVDFRWAPGGGALAFVRADGLYVASGDGSTPRRVLEAATLRDPVWSPDGLKIAVERGAEVWVVEPAAGATRRVAVGSDPAWAPDSKRLAYVTNWDRHQSPVRNQFRLVNWLGENDWPVVRDLPGNTPPIGIPGNEVPLSYLSHGMENPVWDSSGAVIYVAAYVLSQAETDFWIWERVDATQGGSTFLARVAGGDESVASPDRKAVLLPIASATGSVWFEARALEGADAAWRWASTQMELIDSRVYGSLEPAWAPESGAVAYYHCEFRYEGQPSPCTLDVRTPHGRATVLPASLVASIPTPLVWRFTLDWARE